DHNDTSRTSPGDVPSLPPDSEGEPFLERRSLERLRQSFPPSADFLTAATLQGRVSALVNAFRVRGHLWAHLDPLNLNPRPPDELLLERYGLDEVKPDTLFSTGDMAGPEVATLQEIIDRLTQTYNRSIGVEFTFLEDREE